MTASGDPVPGSATTLVYPTAVWCRIMDLDPALPDVAKTAGLSPPPPDSLIRRGVSPPRTDGGCQPPQAPAVTTWMAIFSCGLRPRRRVRCARTLPRPGHLEQANRKSQLEWHSLCWPN